MQGGYALNLEKLKEAGIIHLPSNQFVQPVYYHTVSGEVSYKRENSESVFTCFDYELISTRGLDYLRTVLNNLPTEHFTEFDTDFIMI